MIHRLTRTLSWLFFAVGAAWTIFLFFLIVTTSLRLTPYHFLDLILISQTRETGDYPLFVHHTKAYYLARFLIFTFIVESLGIWSYSYLRYNRKTYDKRSGAEV